MAYFSDTFMGHRRSQWLRSIHAVEVQVGASWHRGTINQKRIEGDTLVILATFPTSVISRRPVSLTCAARWPPTSSDSSKRWPGRELW